MSDEPDDTSEQTDIGANHSNLPENSDFHKQPPLDEDSNLEASKGTLDVPDDVAGNTYYFGFGSFHPKFLQILVNKKFFTFLLCSFVVTQGMVVTGFNSVNISSQETRYSFRSTLAGIYFLIYDLVVVICVVFISYFGGKSHKPRVLGISWVIFAIGTIVLASPQFLFGSYKLSGSSVVTFEQCIIGMTSSNSDNNCEPTNIGAYVILLIGQMLIAVGATALYTVGVAYIDEIVHPKYVSLHIGAVLISGVVGPAIGYLIGSAFLSVYVDPWKETDLDPDDPAWVGAWWIGPLMVGMIVIVYSTLFFMFPRYLPDSHLVRIERSKEMAKTLPKELINVNSVTLTVKQFPIHIKHLLTNPSYMSTAFGLAALFNIRDGVTSFGPKYMESMFGVSSSTSGLLAGAIAITGAVIGVITGALLTYLWKPRARQTTVIMLVVVAICIPFVLVFLVKCSTAKVAGITVPYPDGGFDGRDSSMCSMNCSCQSSVYEPVCGSDGITYFSPCRAGCDVNSLGDGSYVFENCTCIANVTLTESVSHSVLSNATAVEGVCEDDCQNQLYIFVVILLVLVTLLLTIEIPYYYYALRVVADDQRHLALGLQSAIFRIFGAIPSPLLFGAVIDLACIEWEYNCGVRGNCWIYDNDRLSLSAIQLCLPFGVASLILLLIGMITYPTRKPQTQPINSLTEAL